MESIHVDPRDDVPVIIERMRQTASEDVCLLVPPRSRFAESRFNFQLLKQYSTRLGKRVFISSPETAVQRLAEESGLGAVQPNGHQPSWATTPDPAGQTMPVARPGGPPPGRPPGPLYAPPGQPVGRPPGPLYAQAGQAGAAAPAGPLAFLSRLARPAKPALTSIRIGAPRRLPSRLTQYQSARYALYAGAVLVLVAGVLAVLFYVPSATVTLVAQAQPLSTSVDLTADPSKPQVHVRASPLTRQANIGGQATGTKVTPGQLASGQFTYINDCPPPESLQIANGQRLTGPGGAAFYQVGDVVVQAHDQATVSIKAVQAGAAGNVGAGQINGIEANQFTCLRGSNQAPTSGGTDDQKQTVIQSSDIQGAKALLENQLRSTVLTDLRGGAQKGETLASQPVFGPEQFTTTHNVDDPVPSFTATLVLTAEGDYYAADDVQKAFSDKLATKVPANSQLTTNKVAASYTVTASGAGHLHFQGTASGYVAPRIDTARIKGELAGKPAAQAHDVLARLPVQRSVISQSPPLPLLPLSASRIYIDYGVESQASAAAST